MLYIQVLSSTLSVRVIMQSSPVNCAYKLFLNSLVLIVLTQTSPMAALPAAALSKTALSASVQESTSPAAHQVSVDIHVISV